MENIIDMTLPLKTKMPIWSGCKGIRITPIKHMDKGDSFNISRVMCNLHTGTHADAPRHFLQNGTTVERLPLDILTEFIKGFVALTLDAARWIVEKGIRLIGIKYLSVQRYHGDARTHRIRLGIDTIALEGLNLSKIKSGFYELICLPLKLVGVERAPAKAVLLQTPQIDEKQSTTERRP